MRFVLEGMGYEVRTAMNGLDACAQALVWFPDVVLSDLELPLVSGYDVARRLRAYPQGGRMRLIAISGHDEEEYRLRSKRRVSISIW